MSDPNVQPPEDPNLQRPPGQPYQQPGQQPYQQPYQPGAPVAGAPLSEADDVQWGSFAHLVGILSFLPSLIIWIVFKDRGRFTAVEAKEALNFQITLMIAYVVGGILTVVLVGFLVLFAAWLLAIVFGIMAALAANRGEYYTYPLTIRFVG